MRKVLSHAYQYKFCEVRVPSEYLDCFAIEKESAEKRELRLELHDRIVEIANTPGNLTSRQHGVFVEYYVKKQTQVEAAKALGITQSTLAKCVYGIKSFYNSNQVGGLLKRLHVLAMKDKECQDLLTKIQE